MAKKDVPTVNLSPELAAEVGAEPAPVETPSTALTDVQVLEAVKASRANVRKLEQADIELRTAFRQEQDNLRELFKRAEKINGLEVLSRNAQTSGLLDTSDRAAFLNLSEHLVKDLAVRNQL